MASNDERYVMGTCHKCGRPWLAGHVCGQISRHAQEAMDDVVAASIKAAKRLFPDETGEPVFVGHAPSPEASNDDVRGIHVLICEECGEPFSGKDRGLNGSLNGCPCCDGDGKLHRVFPEAEVAALVAVAEAAREWIEDDSFKSALDIKRALARLDEARR